MDGKAVGAIGFVLQKDVDRVSAEVGYWLGEAYWKRGIASEALGAITRHAIATHGLTRVFAVPFAQTSPAMAQTSQSAIDQFIANPSQALQQYPNGGPQLISLIRDVALAHPESLQAIIALLANASSDQQMAIGSGLGQAAQMSAQNNPAFANQIQTALTASGFQNAITAFSGVTGNVSIGSTSPGGGGGGGGGVGGPTGQGSGGPSGGSNSGTGQTFGSSNFQTSSTNSFTGGGSGAGGGTNSGGSSGSTSPH